jgi:hypothetical protein
MQKKGHKLIVNHYGNGDDASNLQKSACNTYHIAKEELLQAFIFLIFRKL